MAETRRNSDFIPPAKLVHLVEPLGFRPVERRGIIGDEDTVADIISAIAALGVEELGASVFACTAEDDARTRKLLGSRALAGVTG